MMGRPSPKHYPKLQDLASLEFNQIPDLMKVLSLCIVAYISPLMGICLAFAFFCKAPTRRNAVICAIGIGAAAALSAYGIRYKSPTDMTRWMDECRYYTGKSFLMIPNSSNPDHSGLLVWNLMCWLVGNVGDLYLLQSLAAFLGYGLVFWLPMRAYANRDISLRQFNYTLLFLFLAIPTQVIVGNVRSALGCILCSIAFCTRKSYDVKRSIPGFVIIAVACLIHSSMVLGLVVYVLQPLISHHPIKLSVLVAICLFVFFSCSPVLAESHLLSEVPIVSRILEKASFYTVGTEWDQQEAKNILSIASHVLGIFLLGLVCLRALFCKKRDNLFAVTILMVLCVVSMETTLANVGNRLQYIPIVTGSLLMLDEESAKAERYKRLLEWVSRLMMIIAFVVCLISMRRFVPTFNYPRVLLSMVFYPSLFF